jgi:drug/metabolite transporter (DMT)-like permease
MDTILTVSILRCQPSSFWEGEAVKQIKSFFFSDNAALVYILLVMVLFGFSFMFTRIALASASAFSLLSWRFFTAFFSMTLLRIFGILKVELKGLPFSLLCIGLFHPILYFIFETLGIAMTSVAESGIIISTIPIVSMILAALFLKERPAILQILSMILATLGTFVVVLGGSTSSHTFNITGYIVLFGAVISGALFFIFSRNAPDYSSASKSYVMMGMGCIAFTAIAAVEHSLEGTVKEWLMLPFRNRGFFISLLYLGVLASIAGTLAMNFSVARIGVHRTSAFAGVATVVSIIAGVFFLREPFTLLQGAGAAVILLGVTGVNKFGRKS